MYKIILYLSELLYKFITKEYTGYTCVGGGGGRDAGVCNKI